MVQGITPYSSIACLIIIFFSVIFLYRYFCIHPQKPKKKKKTTKNLHWWGERLGGSVACTFCSLEKL